MVRVTLQNTVDAWVSPTRTSRFGDTQLYVHSSANAFVFFGRPNFPAGTTINSATLTMYPGPSSGNGSQTLSLHRLTSSWDPNTVTWLAQPTVGALSASSTRTWYDSGAAYALNVTADVQDIVNGGAWYGWRITSNSADTSQYLISSQSATTFGITQPAMTLVIEYTAPPTAPQDLYPRGNAVVNDPKPTLSWGNVGGPSSDIISFQVQVASDAGFTTNLYTSNETFSTASSIDLDVAAPAFTALTSGESRYWRVKVKNTAGLWSDWSTNAQFTYNNAFVVNITAPGATTSDPSPLITWTYGGTQRAYQIFVDTSIASPVTGAGFRLFDSGIQYGTALSYNLPVGIVTDTATTYFITLRVWDTNAIVSVAGVPAYNEDVQAFTWVPTGALPPVQLLITREIAPYPPQLIRWQYTGATARQFTVYRKRFGYVDKVWNVTPAQSQEGATQWYRMVDRTPPGRADVAYGVQTILPSGAASPNADNPEVTIKLDHLVCWVQSVTDSTRTFCLVNYQVDPGLNEVSDVVKPIGGNPYLAISAFGKYNGSASGEISWEAMWPAYSALTGENMKANFMWIRQNPRVYLTWADESIEAFIYGTSIRPFGTGSGKTDYAVSFNFVQV